MARSSLFEAFGAVLGNVVSWAGLSVCKRRLELSDPLIAAMACAGLGLQQLILPLATEDWHVFASEIFGAFQYVIQPCIKSFVVRLVAPDEVAFHSLLRRV